MAASKRRPLYFVDFVRLCILLLYHRPGGRPEIGCLRVLLTRSRYTRRHALLHHSLYIMHCTASCRKQKMTDEVGMRYIPVCWLRGNAILDQVSDRQPKHLVRDGGWEGVDDRTLT